MKSKILVIIAISLLISGCSMPSLPSLPSIPSPPLPELPLNPESIPFVGDLLKKLPFFSTESEDSAPNVSEWKSKELNESRKPEANVTAESSQPTFRVNQTNETASELGRLSELTVSPVYAEYNRSTGRWNVVFELKFVTNVKEEEGRWDVFLYSDKLIDKRTLETMSIGRDFKGFSTKYAVKRLREGQELRIRMEKEVSLIQPGGSTSASYRLEKEKELNIASEVEVKGYETSCAGVDYLLNFSGLIPARLTIDVKLPGKTFSKSFRIVGGESLNVDHDSNLNRDIFEVRNGVTEIHLDLEKFIRIAAIPGEGEIVLKSSKVLSSITFKHPKVSAKVEGGRIVLENANGSLPIYIDSIVLVDENFRSIGVGRILCERLWIEKSYHGRILVVGGPNLFWNDYKERYQTKKPELILFDGEI